MNQVKLNTVLEITTCVTLWCLFIYFDVADPFIREIKPEELWLYSFPPTPSIISARKLWVIIFLAPSILFGIEYYITGKSTDILNAINCMCFAYGLNGTITSILKIMVGRPRPDFYFRCFPGGTGSDFTKCTGIEKDYHDGRKSFPSGHASFSFTCMFFLSLYLARKFQLFKGNKTQSWQLCVCTLLVLVAAGISISRTCDYHHHYQDVAGGALLGTIIAYFSYKIYFVAPEVE